MDPSGPIELTSNFLGCLMSAIGGYICARIVNYNEYKYASIMGLISVGIGLLFSVSTNTAADNVMLILFTYGSVIIGAWVYVRQKNR